MQRAEADAVRPGSRAERFGAGIAELGLEMARSLATGMFSPRSLLSSAIEMAQTSAVGLSACLPASGYPDAWLETANKLRSYRLFAFADTLVANAEQGWDTVDERLRDTDPYTRVWLTEGLGYYFAQCGALPAMRSAAPAERILIPMHTGAGLSLSERALNSACRRDIGGVLREFREKAWTLAQEGYGEVVYEALGLTTVTLFPDLVGAIDRELSGDERLGALFWHGVGRGLYFLPLHFLPLPRARRRPMEFALTAPGTEVGRRNALAGLAWAMTLVNVRDPDIVLGWVREHAWEAGTSVAFGNGVASALIVWLAAAPDDASVETLARYEPPAEDAAVWEQVMRGPIQSARRSGGAASLAATVFRVRAFD